MPVCIWLFNLLVLALLAGACTNPPSQTPSIPSQVPPTVALPTQTPETEPTDHPPPATPLISEVLAGVDGNNVHEYIELYNPSDHPLNLQGYSLWYRLATSEEDLPVIHWQDSTLIPPLGHYLLVHAGQDIGITPDAEFEQGLNISGGGLLLRDPDGVTLDALAWGNSPNSFTEGHPAFDLQNDWSLERLPGGQAGNSIDTNDNAADFKLTAERNPQNSGFPPTPTEAQRLEINLTAPQTAEPGSQYEYILTVTNLSGKSLHGLSTSLQLPGDLKVLELPENASQDEAGIITWKIDQIADSQAAIIIIPVAVPWTYFTAFVHSYYVQAEDWPSMAFGGPVYTYIQGGVIPIGTARTLLDAELTVEGIATMYTGGYYAGSGNTKFYIEDETGGLQVQVFGGENSVILPVGAQVRVRGVMGAYRGSMQIVPTVVPDDVEVVAQKSEKSPWSPTKATIQQATNDFESLPGRLIQVSGLVTRVEEFSYSYEIDLSDEKGYVLTLYVDKLTNINVESIEVDSYYQATGILEERDDNLQLYPRRQSDLTEIFPSILMITAETSNTVQPREVFTVTLTVFNHTTEKATDLAISAPLPDVNARLESIQDQGYLSENSINWIIPELPGNGESISVKYQLRSSGQAGQIEIGGYKASAAELSEEIHGQPVQIFIGNSVPIWAVQGADTRSPYVLDLLTTDGIVTGVFPELGGFWIQSSTPDDNDLTSEGLFIDIDTIALDIPISIGDQVLVSGQVRERSQQTSVIVSNSEGVEVLSQNNDLPQPVELDPPKSMTAATLYYEALEGMLVQVSQPALAVSPTSRYGEYALILSYHKVDRLWQGEDNGFMIMVDDGASDVHYDRTTLDYVIKTGDQVSSLVGPLAYTYGHYKIEPLDTPLITPSSMELPSLESTTAQQFSLMTWNVENLFDVVEPHPSDPPRPRKAEYDIALEKVANTIQEAGAPTIIGLQEVENLGILVDVVLLDSLAAYDYQPILIEGTDSRGIDVGYLVRGDQAKILDVQQYIAPEGLTSRPPLLVQVSISTSRGKLVIYVLNNHFSSLSGGEIATEPRRTAQAAWNVTVIEKILEQDPGAHIAVIGDLNSFLDTLPIQTLEAGGLIHTFDVLPKEKLYNYIFEGESQVLDHILVTPNLMDLLDQVVILHVNADYPLPDPEDTSPMHKSDHDPVIALFYSVP